MKTASAISEDAIPLSPRTRFRDRLDAQTLARLARIDPQLLCPVKHRSKRILR